jgi:hypothetical protein
MDKKVVDLLSYKIEKSLKENGFKVKVDEIKKVKLVMKIRDPR